MKRLLLALKFLTILPLPQIKGEVNEELLGRSSSLFPLAGLIQGGVLTVTVILSENLYSTDIVAALVLTVLILTSGGFHLDGLSDTFDALASRGNRDRMLAVMKESTSGPIGVTAVVIVLLLKYILIREVLATEEYWYVILLLFPMAGKWTMLAGMYHGSSARRDGLGRIFIEGTGIAAFLTGVFYICLSVSVLAAFFSGDSIGRMFFLSATGFIVAYIFTIMTIPFFRKRIGGLTGDTLGAVSEIAEVFFLMVALSLGR
jgi:adenosylcobinamide-GDP ribazoletransferase